MDLCDCSGKDIENNCVFASNAWKCLTCKKDIHVYYNIQFYRSNDYYTYSMVPSWDSVFHKHVNIPQEILKTMEEHKTKLYQLVATTFDENMKPFGFSIGSKDVLEKDEELNKMIKNGTAYLHEEYTYDAVEIEMNIENTSKDDTYRYAIGTATYILLSKNGIKTWHYRPDDKKIDINILKLQI